MGANQITVLLIIGNQYIFTLYRELNNESIKYKKEFSIIVDDKDELIGGRTDDDGQMLQPIKHLSGKIIFYMHIVCLLYKSPGKLIMKMTRKF